MSEGEGGRGCRRKEGNEQGTDLPHGQGGKGARLGANHIDNRHNSRLKDDVDEEEAETAAALLSDEITGNIRTSK